MAVKKNFVIHLTLDWDYLKENGIQPPWYDIAGIDFGRLALFLQKHCYCGDKIEVVAADDYLDCVAIDSALKNGLAQEIISDMSSTMNQSKKLSGKAVLPVSSVWRNRIAAVSRHDKHRSPPPFLLFFQARGSTDITVGMWLASLSAHMGVSPAIAAFTENKDQDFKLFGAFSSELESVFGAKFIKESSLSVI